MGYRRGQNNNIREGSGTLMILAASLLGWEVLGRILEFRNSLLPAPSRIVLEIYREAHMLTDHMLATAAEVCAGGAIALVLALPTGIAAASVHRNGRKLARVMASAPAAPLIAAAPLLSLWFGYGMTGKIAVAALLGFPPMFRHVLKGCRSVPDGPLVLAQLAGASAATVFRKIRLPEALPHLLEGFRSCFVFSLTGAIAAEYIVADRGLGYLLLVSGTTMDTPLLFAGMAMIAVLLLVLFAAVSLLHRTLAPWSV